MNLLVANVYPMQNFAQNFYLADFFDVFIITLLIYSAILLFKQTRSLPALLGIGMLVGLFVLAQIFHLYLTSLALQSFFGVFLVVLVVMFQEELRRFLESIAAWSTRQNAVQPIAIGSPAMYELIQALAHLSHTKTGALVILTGQENIERHIEGGKTLDGIVSEELLLSIFDPTSPGHDGALIINQNRIAQFGAHLPLSNNFKEIGKHGTRHSAALGIAEKSDAFAIVVSEEQGTVSVAYNGKLTLMKNIEELEKHLNKFLKENFPEEIYKPWENIIKKNWLEKIGAIVAAVFLWLIIAFPAESIQRDFTLPISYRNLPDNIIVDTLRPKELTVTLSGRGERSFENIIKEDLQVSIDGKMLDANTNKIQIDESMIVRPISLSIVKINPTEVSVSVKKYKKAEVPIDIKIQGAPARGYMVDNIFSVPRNVIILVPEQSDIPQNIPTEIVDITGLNHTESFNAKLLLPTNIRFQKETDSTSAVTVSIRKK